MPSSHPIISTDAARPALYEASKKYSDILSVNVYAHSIANFPIEKLPNMPVVVTFPVYITGKLSIRL